MTERFICVHGHFYQPPRENPWLESIEQQDSAYPYHDWNERITAECYAPNAASRILDAEDHIRSIVNNYKKISFNFGPTLLSYLEQGSPETYRAILEADRESLKLFDGHGSALAQAYNHMILPLANSADKRCQVVWGIRDFARRFGREPQGMWLPETAVDLETLEVLAARGIRYTILSPEQAGRVRSRRGGRWRDVSGGRIDPTRAYVQRLPSGRRIALFFFHGPVSRAVAFEHLLDRGESLAGRLAGAFSESPRHSELVHLATDGETFGHHHRFGDMALAFALNHIEGQGLATLTNYSAYLERHPPTWEVEIRENTSWSCFHGVERWHADCGCSSGAHPDWSQAWRGPLRLSLDALRDRMASLYEREAGRLFRDPWEARENYVDVVLDRSRASRDRFLAAHAAGELSGVRRVAAWKLLEMQRQAMLMYTSCGWFFDDLSGIETVQVLRYACRAIQLAREVAGVDLEPDFLASLEAAASNRPEEGDGRQLWERHVRAASVDLPKVGAHYAVSGLFRPYRPDETIYGYRVEREREQVDREGRASLALGRIRVASVITEESAKLEYAVVHFGDHNLTGGIETCEDGDDDEVMRRELQEAFAAADLPEVVRRLDARFAGATYSLKTLFRDDQRRILDGLLKATTEEAAVAYRRLHTNHAPLMRFLGELGMPPPAPFRAAGELVLNESIRAAMQQQEIDVEGIRRGVEEARQENVVLDREGLGYTLQKAIEQKIELLRAAPDDLARAGRLEAAVRLARSAGLETDLWKVENAFYQLLRDHYAEQAERSANGDRAAADWVRCYDTLGQVLRIRVPRRVYS